MENKKIKVKLNVEVESDFEGAEVDEETVRYLVKQDLLDNDWHVNKIEVGSNIKKENKGLREENEELKQKYNKLKKEFNSVLESNISLAKLNIKREDDM